MLGSQGLLLIIPTTENVLYLAHSLPLFKSLHHRRLPRSHYLKTTSSLLIPVILLYFLHSAYHYLTSHHIPLVI